jgi:Tfp pilus assembly protein PilP
MTALVAAAIFTLLPAAGLEAQQGSRPAAGEAPGQAAANLTLVYDREVYTYSATGRRDPFRALTTGDAMGPRFDALTLQGIIYSTGRGRSVALLNDVEGRIYRVRVGDLLGTSQVIEIGPTRVVMAVDNFGTIRQEILELPSKEGTN